jgi:transposase-like protein
MAAGGFFIPAEVSMPPRLTLEPGDLVTPAQAAAELGVTPNLVRVWIHRHGIKPLGELGRRSVYDYNEIAAVDARLRRKREQRHGPAAEPGPCLQAVA